MAAKGRFQPHRSPDVDARIRHIETYLSAIGAVVGPAVADASAEKNTGNAAVVASAGGGGSGPAVLAGDVTGPAANTFVALLQGVTLTLTSPATGQLLVYTGAAIVNTATLPASITLADTANLVLGTSAGSQIGTATNQKLAFYGAPPITQLAAYTPAGTATRTFPADPSSGYTGVDNAQAGSVYALVADLNTLRGVVSSLLGVVRQLVQDLGKTAGHGLNAT